MNNKDSDIDFSSLEAAISSLTAEQRSYLQSGFERMSPTFIVEGTLFVGVHCEQNPNLIIDKNKGYWSLGRVRQ